MTGRPLELQRFRLRQRDFRALPALPRSLRLNHGGIVALFFLELVASEFGVDPSSACVSRQLSDSSSRAT